MLFLVAVTLKQGAELGLSLCWVFLVGVKFRPLPDFFDGFDERRRVRCAGDQDQTLGWDYGNSVNSCFGLYIIRSNSNHFETKGEVMKVGTFYFTETLLHSGSEVFATLEIHFQYANLQKRTTKNIRKLIGRLNNYMIVSFFSYRKVQILHCCVSQCVRVELGFLLLLSVDQKQNKESYMT